MNRGVRLVLSVVVWWSAAGVALWLVGLALGWPVSLAGCVLSGLFLGAIGEAGDRLRRVWKSRRRAARM
ncbi:hypothetical protein [Streptomyces sp. LaPpAH-108]|uniref:hypothetical protein n=1 Tax=Streptomyces sp. LaPpAH-108 TaxID=1155714 RepID=UPI0003A31882|nr:hypothetical protein [Streptomyces sp. LaPpAH-108]